VDLLRRPGLGVAVRGELRQAAPPAGGLFFIGATHTLTRRIQDWWLTAVGEVPAQTLRAFSLNLERRK
jgi:negative regulator of sigma E activity